MHIFVHKRLYRTVDLSLSVEVLRSQKPEKVYLKIMLAKLNYGISSPTADIVFLS